MMMMTMTMTMMMMKIMLDLGILTSGTTPNLDMPPPYSLVILG